MQLSSGSDESSIPRWPKSVFSTRVTLAQRPVNKGGGSGGWRSQCPSPPLRPSVHWSACPTHPAHLQDHLETGDGAGHSSLSWSPSHHAFSHPSATYIKVYLLENGACLAKKKTKVAKKTCDPLYQQALRFDEGPQGKVLQVSVRAACRLQVVIRRSFHL